MTEAVKHTLGPWMVSEDDPLEILMDDENGVNALIATVEFENVDAQQAEADARLIAAAPELLNLAAQYRDDLHHPPSQDSKQRRLALIEAVIAKAEGRS